MPPKKNSGLTTSLENTENVFDNTSEDRILINESKARLIYKNHIKNNTFGGLCGTFFGLFLTCLIAVLTSTFHDIFYIEGSSVFVKLSFIFGTGVFFICFIVFLIIWIVHKVKYSEKKFIAALKNTNPPAKTTKSKNAKSSKK